jgi:hypothetical protein
MDSAMWGAQSLRRRSNQATVVHIIICGSQERIHASGLAKRAGQSASRRMMGQVRREKVAQKRSEAVEMIDTRHFVRGGAGNCQA